MKFVLPELSPEGKKEYSRKIIPDIEFCFENKYCKYIAVLNNNAIKGACGFSIKGHIAQLFVQESEQGKGLGSSLLSKAISVCESSKITVNASTNAISYYQGQGFEATEEKQNKNGICYVPMAKYNS